MRSYPSEHKEIVSNLLDGRFIIYPNPMFIVIQKLEDDYTEFFKESYGFELKINSEFTYLSSNEVTEKSTRDFTLFLAMLCREIDYRGKNNFKDLIELFPFDIIQTEQLLRESSKWEILERTSVGKDFNSFINTWHRKNVLIRDGNQFKFTKAIKLFFEFAVNIANSKLKEQPLL